MVYILYPLAARTFSRARKDTEPRTLLAFWTEPLGEPLFPQLAEFTITEPQSRERWLSSACPACEWAEVSPLGSSEKLDSEAISSRIYVLMPAMVKGACQSSNGPRVVMFSLQVPKCGN